MGSGGDAQPQTLENATQIGNKQTNRSPSGAENQERAQAGSREPQESSTADSAFTGTVSPHASCKSGVSRTLTDREYSLVLAGGDAVLGTWFTVRSFRIFEREREASGGDTHRNSWTAGENGRNGRRGQKRTLRTSGEGPRNCGARGAAARSAPASPRSPITCLGGPRGGGRNRVGPAETQANVILTSGWGAPRWGAPKGDRRWVDSTKIKNSVPAKGQGKSCWVEHGQRAEGHRAVCGGRAVPEEEDRAPSASLHALAASLPGDPGWSHSREA